MRLQHVRFRHRDMRRWGAYVGRGFLDVQLGPHRWRWFW